MSGNDGHSADRRRHPRTQLRMTLHGIKLDPDGDVMDSFQMLDISRGGMGAISNQPYYPGQRVVLSLPLSESGGRRNIYATVVRCRHGHDGYQVGMKFDSGSAGAWCASGDFAAAAAA